MVNHGKNQLEPIDILYIEDNPNDIELTLRIFKNNNISNNIKIIKDGEEAYNYLFQSELINQNKPKLILLDLKLPKISGLEILQKLKAENQTRAIPVVVFTSSLEEKDLIESYRLGVNSYVVKPMDFDDFSKAVAKLGIYWMLINENC